ncbi:11049_t:CDS:2, partial [Paraglomus occultum]
YDEPAERYTPDGRLVKNESPRETKEDIPLKEILRRPYLREEFLKEAHESIAIDKDALKKEDVTIESESDEELWSKDIEDRFFSYLNHLLREEMTIYFAFREFFVKYKSHRKIKLKQLAKEQPSQKRLTTSAEELKSVKYALALFDDFKRKKDAATKEKISLK